jgi:hypothetical protein
MHLADKKITVQGIIQLGSELLLEKKLMGEKETENIKIRIKGPSNIERWKFRPIVDQSGIGVNEDKFQYSFSEGNRQLFIEDQGLCQTYGIFGVPGCGKTYLLKHLLAQLIKLNADKKEKKFGGLILDPKGALLGEIIELFKDAGREKDLVIINDGYMKEEGKALNILDCYLQPVDLGKAMSMAAQSAGISSKEPYWLNELGTIFGAGMELLYFQRNLRKTKPNLKNLVELLLDVVDTKELGPDRFQPKLKIYLQAMYDHPPEMSDQEAMQFSVSSGILERFLSNTKDKPVLSSFIDQSYGLFRRPDYYIFSDEYLDSNEKNIYDSTIEDGKFILVSISRRSLAISKILCTLIKTLFQQTVLTRLDRHFSNELANYERPLLFMADEYSDVATELEGQPMGDGLFFSQMRQFGCMGLVATQSVHMLKNSSLRDAWKSIYANMAAKLFMQLGDYETAEEASKLVGESEIRAVMVDNSVSKDGTNISSRHEIKDKKDLPTRVVLQTLGRGQAVLIGSVDGKSRPSTHFLAVKGHLFNSKGDQNDSP